MTPIRLLTPLAALALYATACGSDDAESGADAAVSDATADTANADTGSDEDVATVGDVSSPPDTDENGCDQQDLVEAWPLNEELSDGEITTVADGDAFVSTIDASAGGSQASRENAFIYLDLVAGEQYYQTDLESLTDDVWVLGFRRTNVRLNSGDSGPGSWEMIRVGDTTFADVTAVPGDDAQWEVDATFDDECGIVLDPIGNPFTAINYLNSFNPSGSASWYDYGEAGVSPIDTDVYVVRNTVTEAAFKFAIEGWEDGVFTLRWAQLAP
jgi:hypothetical protein